MAAWPCRKAPASASSSTAIGSKNGRPPTPSIKAASWCGSAPPVARSPTCVEPLGSTDNLRFHERLHRNGIPGRPASYANPLTSEFWDAEKDPENFANLWARTADGPIWKEE